ncbi:hypothetical protein FUAX_43760 (plasmid) [Fulvitalea axinellae]|uniref:FAS1 domain-containing protein n=1 Tax=Fulvitalea axinellae TaxID=1182444 RepID=A0AAU9DBT5_9BACT|nr:hypothetical protein FUAX_43760 [Fulvitalea axinellae]
MKVNFYSIRYGLVLLLLLLYGCNDDIDHHEIPDNLSARLVAGMEQQPDLQQFVKGIDILDIREDLESSAYTVFPPTDEAVLKFIKDKYNASDISEIPEEAVKMLVRGHIVRNSMSWDYLLILGPNGGFRPGPDQPNWDIRLWDFKIPTIYNAPPIVDTDPTTGKTRKLWRKANYLPIHYSHQKLGLLNPDEDYKLLYPTSEYTGFNVQGAVAIRPNQATINGFFHVIDRVIPTLGNPDLFLKENADEFGLFRELMTRFVKYNYTAKGTNEQKGEVKDSLFIKSYYGNHFRYFCEDVTGEGNVYHVLGHVNDFFPPNNEALLNYLTETFVTPGYYGSIEEIPDDALVPLLKNHYKLTMNGEGTRWLRPTEWSYFSSGLGQKASIEPSNVVKTDFTNSAVIYGLNKVLAPALYKSALGRLATDPDYSYMLKIVNDMGLDGRIIASPDMKVTVFMPSNQAMVASGYEYDETTNKFTTPTNTDGVEPRFLSSLVMQHVVLEEDITDLPDKRFAENMSGGQYLSISKAGVLGGGNYQKNASKPVKILFKEDKGVNGTFYGIDRVLEPADKTPGEYLSDNFRTEFSEFLKLLKSAGYVDERMELTNLRGEGPFTILAPSNQAIVDNKDIIPTGDRKALREFLDYHFLRQDAVFADGTVQGDLLTTHKIGTGKYTPLTVRNTPAELSFVDGKGRTVKAIDDERYGNFPALNGTVQLIDNILLRE